MFDDTPSEEIDVYRLYSLNSNKYTAIAKRRSKNDVLYQMVKKLIQQL